MDKTFTDKEMGQLIGLLRHVCSLAIAGMSLSSAASGLDDDGPDLQGHIRMLQSTIDRMGWIADLGLKKLGDVGCFDSAEDWMLRSAG